MDVEGGSGGRYRHPIFDAHMHIIDPRYPLGRNQGYLPSNFTAADYRAQTADLNVLGGAVVSGSFQGFDQSYLVDALANLGPGFVGVTQLPTDVADAEIERLDSAGVRALRFNLVRSNCHDIDGICRFANRIDQLVGWHAEFYVNSRDLSALESRLLKLPRIVIDHLGMTCDGYAALLRLVGAGARIKASGFGRVDLDVNGSLQAIAAVNPAALVFGTDLPGTRARRPFVRSDIDRLFDALGASWASRVLYNNALDLYRVR